MIFITYKVLNLSSLSTQSLASCVNYFVWNCLTCFSNTKIGSVTSFSILFNFQGPVAPQPSGLRLDYFITEVIFCQALFSKFFVSYRTWSVLSFSALTGTFGRLLVLFALLPAGTQKDSEVILLSQRLALKYNTIRRATLQAFFAFFSPFFALCIHQPVFRSVSGDVLTFLPPFLRKNSRRTKSAAAVALGFSSFLPVSSPAGSARPLLPTSAARQSGQWAWVPVHYNRHLQG